MDELFSPDPEICVMFYHHGISNCYRMTMAAKRGRAMAVKFLQKQSVHLDGRIHPDFGAVESTLRDQLRNYPGGAGVCVYHRGERVVDLPLQAYTVSYFLIFVNLTPLNQAGAPSIGLLSK